MRQTGFSHLISPAVITMLSALVCAASAKAADLEPQTNIGWSGFYVGAYVGGGAATSEMDASAGGFLGAGIDGIGGHGIIAGGMAGYNQQVSDQLVLGLQGEIGFENLKTTGNLSAPGVPLSASGSYKPTFTAAVSGRIGWLAQPHTMIYLIGGYSHARYRLKGSTAGTLFGTPFNFSLTRKKSYNGFHIGTGMETVLNGALSLRVEYRYTRYSSKNWFSIASLQPSTHTGRVGLVWRFNGAEGARVTPPAPGMEWTGFYLGVYAGGGGAVSDIGGSIVGWGSAGFDGVGGNGLIGGGMAGYNQQVSDQLVLGLQGEIGFENLKTTAYLSMPGVPLSASGSYKPTFSAAVSGRIGWLVHPETMLYMIGGYSHARYRLKGSAAGTLFGTPFSFSLTRKKSYNGFHVGVGMETRLNDRLSMRVEYRYTRYSSKGWLSIGSVQPSTHTGRVGLVWNF